MPGSSNGTNVCRMHSFLNKNTYFCRIEHPGTVYPSMNDPFSRGHWLKGSNQNPSPPESPFGSGCGLQSPARRHLQTCLQSVHWSPIIRSEAITFRLEHVAPSLAQMLASMSWDSWGPDLHLCSAVFFGRLRHQETVVHVTSSVSSSPYPSPPLSATVDNDPIMIPSFAAMAMASTAGGCTLRSSERWLFAAASSGAKLGLWCQVFVE